MTEETYFQMHQWRPISFERYAQEMGMLALTVADGHELSTMSESLPDGRYRMATYAPVKPRPFEGQTENEPYLIVLYENESNKAHCFVRTDVDAAYVDG